MRAWCMSKRKFEQYCLDNGWQPDVNPPDAVISICCNPDVAEKVLKDGDPHYFSDGLSNVLNVEFDDITSDKETYDGQETDGYDKVTAYGITPETAERIVRFIEDHKHMDFVIHCRAGKSRSQAVTRYILDFYRDHDNFNPANPCIFHNVHTYVALKNARERLGLC